MAKQISFSTRINQARGLMEAEDFIGAQNEVLCVLTHAKAEYICTEAQDLLKEINQAFDAKGASSAPTGEVIAAAGPAPAPAQPEGVILAVTGHRPQKVGGFSEENFARLVDFAERVLKAQPVKIRGCYIGMALGVDQAFAQACVNLGIPFVACVPCEGQEKPWPAKSQARFHELLSKAVQVKVLAKTYSGAAMMRRNEYMVDRADVVIALWDGSDGGTSNCVAYADAIGVAIQNWWTKWLAFSAAKDAIEVARKDALGVLSRYWHELPQAQPAIVQAMNAVKAARSRKEIAAALLTLNPQA